MFGSNTSCRWKADFSERWIINIDPTISETCFFFLISPQWFKLSSTRFLKITFGYSYSDGCDQNHVNLKIHALAFFQIHLFEFFSKISKTRTWNLHNFFQELTFERRGVKDSRFACETHTAQVIDYSNTCLQIEQLIILQSNRFIIIRIHRSGLEFSTIKA